MLDPEDLSDRLGAFVQHNWLSLAAAAWRNYMKFGKGYMLFDWNAIESWRQGTRFTASAALRHRCRTGSSQRNHCAVRP
jgi:hypothetical protein